MDDGKYKMKISKGKIDFFRATLLIWFAASGRKFLWRESSSSNYLKIISEILLQRTKAETVNKYIPAFLNRFPNWNTLGSATEGELIEIFKPLGLSTQRGKRLYKLAQELKSRKGIFPDDRSQVQEMPMMGQYITNAYELFILKQPAPLLDVNMARVLERFFGNRKLSDIRYDPYLQKLAKDIVECDKSIEINWAILDFGALTCKSRNPSCLTCLIRKRCKYYKNTPAAKNY